MNKEAINKLLSYYIYYMPPWDFLYAKKALSTEVGTEKKRKQYNYLQLRFESIVFLFASTVDIE